MKAMWTKKKYIFLILFMFFYSSLAKGQNHKINMLLHLSNTDAGFCICVFKQQQNSQKVATSKGPQLSVWKVDNFLAGPSDKCLGNQMMKSHLLEYCHSNRNRTR